ncbi:hypothetical protein CK627_20865 [Aeromonas dhakensis]|uniref:P27 family phage terminase small subunit n=1 Tax=Aeromonas dhakensis TaxID=196024 RepID=UPI000BAAE300|nr:P27 family phage terminase small subunit [Aeromonas dhakensis]ASX13061.1 hypothetical protein CK627_20865 [Aeromonas dhakensis]
MTQKRARVQLAIKHKDVTLYTDLLVKALEANGIDPTLYLLAIAFQAERFATYKRAHIELMTDGDMITQPGDKGQPRKIQSPLVHVRDRAFKDLQDGLKEFGLTPKSKSAIQAESPSANEARMDLIKALTQLPTLDGGEYDL